MYMQWNLFLFLLAFDVRRSNAAPGNIIPVLEGLDLDNLRYPDSPRIEQLVTAALVIPEELPSALSVAYANIPPIVRGTDSRIGVGWALGNHADFQLMLEIGPQNYTKPLDGTGFRPIGPSNTKRQAPSPPKITKSREKLLQTEAGKHLQNWAQKIKHFQKQPSATKPDEVLNFEESKVEVVQNEDEEYGVYQPVPRNLSPKILQNLRQLYKVVDEPAKTMPPPKRSEEELKRITEELSNVDLD